MKDDFFNDISKINLDDYDEDGTNIKEAHKKQIVEDSINSDNASELDKKIAGKIKAIKVLLHAKAFGRAEALLDEVEKAELERADSEGYCDNPEVFWCKVLIKNQARDEADLISKHPDLENDEDFLLAVEWSKTDEQRNFYQTVLKNSSRSASSREENVVTKSEKSESAPDGDAIKKKLKRIARLVDAGDFEEAEERLKKIEEDEVDRTGDCEIPQVYYYKMLLDYGARTDGELIEKLAKKQDDITQNKNYRLAKSCAEDADDDDELDALLNIKKQAAAGIAKAKAEAEAKAEEERKKQEEEARINAILNVGDYKDIGNGYITFGAYPQSKKASSVTIGEIFDKEHGYYLGSDNCLYDMYDGEYYKVEPIKWKVLSRGSEQFIVTDLIIDQHRFDGSGNNYANSEIRSWLNGEFYNKAFRDGQKNKIVTTNVDNSLASTCDSSNQYVCGNTSDKVYLLSRKETEQYFNSSSARQKKGTDYAKARNLYVASNGNSWWWLRSPFYCGSDNAQAVNLDGDFVSDNVYNSNVGVFPALKFKP